MCGGTEGTKSESLAIEGLSPRVRGNPGKPKAEGLLGGSIPACAGEPVRREGPGGRQRVYPRVCGGTRCLILAADAQAGLSPRVRGNHSTTNTANSASGSIPACAGEPKASSPDRFTERVYPRVCGGTTWTMATCTRSEGLSPRVRGNLTSTTPRPSGSGSIPACAGEPQPFVDLIQRVRVYPRVCGGTIGSVWPRGVNSGLSPRVRGNQGGAGLQRGGRGSIPACAGEPTGSSWSLTEPGVYPRVCGGTSHGLIWRSAITGLSPRVRGNRAVDHGECVLVGSIPACAGEPTTTPCDGHMSGVYPRVCGGTFAFRVPWW